MKSRTKLFNRVAAIIVRDGHVLTHESENDKGVTYQALPGGHLEADETASECLLREMREEFDVAIVVDGLAYVAEGFFARGERRMHEVVFYFVAHLEDADADVRSREKHIRARWLPVEGGLATLLPPWVRVAVPRLAAHTGRTSIEYVVARE